MKKEIPNKAEWGNHKEDVDINRAYQIFGGKSIDEVQDILSVGLLNFISEFQYMPAGPFNYYVRAIIHYLYSDKSKGDSDSPSIFMGIIKYRVENYYENMKEIMPILIEAIKYISERQEYYESDQEIYGDFKQKEFDILKLIKDNTERNA
jgi:hypothetical protein